MRLSPAVLKKPRGAETSASCELLKDADRRRLAGLKMICENPLNLCLNPRTPETVAPTLAQSGELLEGGEYLVDFFAADREIGDGPEGVWAGVEQAHV